MGIDRETMERLKNEFFPAYGLSIKEFENKTYIVEAKYYYLGVPKPAEVAPPTLFSKEDPDTGELKTWTLHTEEAEYADYQEALQKHEDDFFKAKAGMIIRRICNVAIKIESCQPKKTRGKTAYVYNCLVSFHNKPSVEAQFSAKDFTSAKLFCAALMGQTPGGCFYGNNKDLEEYKKVLLNDLENIPCK